LASSIACYLANFSFSRPSLRLSSDSAANRSFSSFNAYKRAASYFSYSALLAALSLANSSAFFFSSAILAFFSFSAYSKSFLLSIAFFAALAASSTAAYLA
jgi:hypothetical protein